MSFINRDSLTRVDTDVSKYDNILGFRLFLLASLAAAIVSACVAVYIIMDSGRLDFVSITRQPMGGPMKLQKFSQVQTPLQVDRYVRDFARNFLRLRFILPHDSSDRARDALAWQEVHTGSSGRKRALALANDFKNFEKTRKNTYSMFFKYERPTAFKLRRVNSGFVVEMDGSFCSTVNKQEINYDGAILHLDISQVAVSGMKGDLGEENITGLVVDDAYVEYIQDVVAGKKSKCRIPLLSGDAALGQPCS